MKFREWEAACTAAVCSGCRDWAKSSPRSAAYSQATSGLCLRSLHLSGLICKRVSTLYIVMKMKLDNPGKGALSVGLELAASSESSWEMQNLRSRPDLPNRSRQSVLQAIHLNHPSSQMLHVKKLWLSETHYHHWL